MRRLAQSPGSGWALLAALLLLRADALDAETVASLKEIEALSRRMRELLQQA